MRMGSITQQGSGSFAILLDAALVNESFRPDAKFVVESNNTVPDQGTRLFSVSESFETRVHQGGLRADKYVTTTNVTASIISASSNIIANSFTGIFQGALSSSAQISNNISGSFNAPSSSFSSRISTIETSIDGGSF